MKIFSLCVIAVFISNQYTCSQSVAIGHISAEIIGGTITLNKIGNDRGSNQVALIATFPSKDSDNSSDIMLGEFRTCLNSTDIFSTVINQINLADQHGKEMLITPLNSDISTSNEETIIRFNGKPALPGQAPGFYQGFCTITFAFN